MPELPPCSLHATGRAVVRVWMEEGCYAKRTRAQDLCLQHLHSVLPRTTFEVTHVYDRRLFEWFKERPHAVTG